MHTVEHRRRTVRRWRCTCGSRFPCGAYLSRRDQESRRIHPGGTAGATLVGWSIGHRQVVTGGIAIVGAEIRVDPRTVYYLHDVDRAPDGDDCPVCGENYPCEVREAVELLEEALKPWRDKISAPPGAADERK